MKNGLFRIGALLAIACIVSGCHHATPGITKVDDLKHATLAVQIGSAMEASVPKVFPDAIVKHFDTFPDSVSALLGGHVDAVMTVQVTAQQITKIHHDMTFLPDSLGDEAVGIAFKKGNDALRTSINDIIRQLHDDGALADMQRRWMKADSLPYEQVSLPTVTGGDPLRVGIAAVLEPIVFINQQGIPSGHDAELARRIGVKLGRPIEFRDMKLAALIPALQSGKIDVIITGLMATPERKKSVDFSDPYFAHRTVALIRKTGSSSVAASDPKSGSAQAPAPSMSASSGLNSVDDLKNKRIAVNLGSVYDAYAHEHFPDASIVQYTSFTDVLLAVSAGKADAGFTDSGPLKEAMRQDDHFAILGQPLFTSKAGVAFNKSNLALREQFNQFLAELRRSGLYAQMNRRWLEQHDTQMPTIAEPSVTQGTLVVGVANSGLPMCAVQSNELVGFDVEMARRFAASIGKKVEFKDMNFSGLIAAVASHKVDLAIASIFITEARKLQVDFSDPYAEQDGVAFIAKTPTTATSDVAKSAATAAPARVVPGFWSGVSNSFYNNIIKEQRYLLLLDGLKATVVISIFSTLFGTALGALICFMRMSPLAALRMPAKIYISVLRGTPVLVLLMLIFYVVFAATDISPVLVAVIAFGMNFAAYVSEMFRSGIQSLDRGQAEAGTAMGFTRQQVFGYIVLPQMLQRILPVYKGEFISLVKMTSVVGYIAVQDLTKASDIIRSRTFDAFFPLVMVAILYYAISWILMQALEYLERVTDPKHGRNKAGAQ